MRLIDADALGVGRCSPEVLPATYCAGWNGLLNLIETAPTIDPSTLRTKGEWISVEDRLPEEHTTVLVLCKNGAMFTGYQFRHFDDDTRWKIHTALSSTKLLNKGRVSHWMPLPEPPDMRGEKDERKAD